MFWLPTHTFFKKDRTGRRNRNFPLAALFRCNGVGHAALRYRRPGGDKPDGHEAYEYVSYWPTGPFSSAVPATTVTYDHDLKAEGREPDVTFTLHVDHVERLHAAWERLKPSTESPRKYWIFTNDPEAPVCTSAVLQVLMAGVDPARLSRLRKPLFDPSRIRQYTIGSAMSKVEALWNQEQRDRAFA